jgi:hypothetical protein
MASAAAGCRAGGQDGRGRRKRSGARARHATWPAGLEGNVDLGHLAEVRLYRLLGPRAVGREDAQGP